MSMCAYIYIFLVDDGHRAPRPCACACACVRACACVCACVCICACVSKISNILDCVSVPVPVPVSVSVSVPMPLPVWSRWDVEAASMAAEGRAPAHLPVGRLLKRMCFLQNVFSSL